VIDAGTGRFRFGAIYGFGTVMGFTPEQVDRMSFWEFGACADGWVSANVPTKPAPPTDAEFDDAVRRLH
jgi:hypothetical protein